MKEIVEKYLNKKNLLNKDNTFIIALSGGFDSMALADIFIDLSKKIGFRVVLAHLNHNWRGEKSLAEAKNCEKFAKDNGVEFYTETLSDDIPHTETAAREERYAFFERAAKKFNTNKIFTAHTMSDNIETVLQRIIKGTGITGLCGINDERILNNAVVYRPILDCSRQDVISYCTEKKLTPNEDDSNKDIKYFRNRIREKLLPDLKEHYDKNTEKAILRLIQNAKDNEELIEEYLKNKIADVVEEDEISTQNFLKLSSPIKKRIIKKLLENKGYDYDQKRIVETIDFIENSSSLKAGKTFSVGADKWLFVNNKITKIIDKDDYNEQFASMEINMEGETYLKEFDAVVKFSKWTDGIPAEYPKDDENTIYADFSSIESPLYFRTRVFGDRIVPFGKNSPIKLKKYLNNKGLSKHDKSKVLLISSEKEVLWVINWGISNSIKVKNIPTHKVEFYIRSKHE